MSKASTSIKGRAPVVAYRRAYKIFAKPARNSGRVSTTEEVDRQLVALRRKVSSLERTVASLRRRFEEHEDIQDSRAALAEPGQSIPYEQIRRELRLGK